MQFLLLVQHNTDGMPQHLGVADYSYAYVMRGFAPVLARLGKVRNVANSSEAEAIYYECLGRAEPCVLLSFAPPHKTPLELRVPTIPVFAWEYPEIPEQIEERCWQGDPRNDWRLVFAHTGRAICLSQHTAAAVRRSMGRHYPISAVPSPLPESDGLHVLPALGGRWLRVTIGVVDSDLLGLDIDAVMHPDTADDTPYDLDDHQLLPTLASPYPLRDGPHVLRAETLDAPADDLYRPPPPGDWNIPTRMDARLHLHGVVFTTVLNPAAGRKNLEDIITAFCWTFRDTEDATLILKLTGQDLLPSHYKLLMLLSKLSTFRCRVIALYGYLFDPDYAALIEASTYYVNASTCEGQCLPLVEFLNRGVPAIATDNTAMADYIEPDLAFVVESMPGLCTCWPHGDREISRTSEHQVNWESLASAYRTAYEVAATQPERYQSMGHAAQKAIQAYCGEHAVEQELRHFFRAELASTAVPAWPEAKAS